MGIFDSAKKAAVGKALELALKHAKKDPADGLLDLVNFAENYIPVKNGAAGFKRAREIFGDPGSKWTLFANSVLRDVDMNVIKTIILNGGYEAGYRGRELAREAKAELRCEIPLTVLIEPTSACTLRCSGCCAEGLDGLQNLSFDEMDALISQGKKLGIFFYQFTGGEPLGRKAELLKLCRRHSDCVFHIMTNGMLMDRQLCMDLKEAGNVFVSVGIDGFEPLCDMSRGTGSFDKALTAMSLMRENGLLFGACVCCTSRNIAEVTSDAFFDLLVSMGSKYCLFLQYMPVGNGALPELMLSAAQREQLFRAVRLLRSPGCPKPIVAADFQDDELFLGGCVGGGRGFMAVRANGYAEPCLFLHYSNANIKKMSLAGALRQPLFAEFSKSYPFSDNPLRSCPLLDRPDLLSKMVGNSRAKSTSLADPETVERLCGSCAEAAESWRPVADRLRGEIKH